MTQRRIARCLNGLVGRVVALARLQFENRLHPRRTAAVGIRQDVQMRVMNLKAMCSMKEAYHD
jgi:hypothetical protein